MTNEQHTPTQADPILNRPQFNALLWDLLEPTRSAIDIANDYDITLDQLAAVLESPRFADALAAIARINTARQRFLDLESAPLAKARLLAQLRDTPITATVRKIPAIPNKPLAFHPAPRYTTPRHTTRTLLTTPAAHTTHAARATPHVSDNASASPPPITRTPRE